MSLLEDVVGGGLGFLVGGPIGAAVGAGLGEAASGGSPLDIIKAGGLGWLGGEFLPGAFGAGEAAAGTGANLASMGGGQGLMAPGLTLGEMGGGTGLTWGGLGEGGPLTALGGGVGLGELGSLGIGSDLAAMGGAQGLTTTLGAGGLSETGAGGGLFDTLRRKFGALGFGGQGGVSNALMLGSGLMGLSSANQMSRMAAQADPFGPYRAGYAAQLRDLTANPSSITSLPGYRSGLQAVQRSMGAQGYAGSGNMMAALAGYGGDFYQQQLQNLSSLAGVGISPAVGLQGQLGAANLTSRGLASLGYGARMMGA